MNAIAAPIFASGSYFEGSIGIVGPSAIVNPTLNMAQAAAVVSAAHRVSLALGEAHKRG
ncbi:hypothetical protein IVB18_50155 (plasmid) [Bradyrhizobium sp. 186]|uniref:hypothetical protein n=1 Tax=Bradyrhizobium sp. 186 TaxID=2782654 RepID=UPI002000931E|nr:hypothetical protein [Bradyrhizobium sp. 186]UPK40795.1 hypothetical protein IVB18_50155 [Bradyrhizobium sp. 186]